jgi:cytochrome o ubiquinol oxidase subunit 2
MIYTMNGMTTRLNLQADKPGTFRGLSTQFSGDGFADMLFDVHVVPPEQFSGWAQNAADAQQSLDRQSYQELAKPSIKHPQATYRLGDPDLFRAIATQEIPPAPGAQAGVKGAALPTEAANAR